MAKEIYANQSMVKPFYQFVDLYKFNKGGSVLTFHLAVDWMEKGNLKCYCVITRKGLLHGAMQEDCYPITEGKNIGKANETTPLAQAKVMFNSIYNKQRDKGYVEITGPNSDSLMETLQKAKGRDASGELKPMLAYKTIQYIKFPCYAQRKYDGIRNFTGFKYDGKLHMTSRNGKEFLHLNHIIKDLEGVLKPGEILDGELYSHSMNFQQIISAVKREQPGNKEIKIRAYDMGTDHPQDRRLRRLKRVCKLAGPSVEYCPTYEVNNLEEAMALFAIFIEEGYEGMILRNKKSKYEFGTRSHNLAKYKEFDEEEFEIIGVHEAEGRDAGTAILECSCKGGSFRCRPMGDRATRAAYLTLGDELIGERLTVKYQGLSDTGIPRFPIGKVIRDYE
jgi:DNA ligase-1